MGVVAMTEIQMHGMALLESRAHAAHVATAHRRQCAVSQPVMRVHRVTSHTHCYFYTFPDALTAVVPEGIGDAIWGLDAPDGAAVGRRGRACASGLPIPCTAAPRRGPGSTARCGLSSPAFIDWSSDSCGSQALAVVLPIWLSRLQGLAGTPGVHVPRRELEATHSNFSAALLA
eukprot:360958-Chlamydomonas_euryale.AAC.4